MALASDIAAEAVAAAAAAKDSCSLCQSALVGSMFGSTPQAALLPWIEPSICEMLQAAAGGLSLRLCYHARPISQTGTAGVILLRMDVVIVRLDVHLASRFAGSTRRLEQQRQCGGSLRLEGGLESAYFWHLKDDSPQASSSASLVPFLGPSLAPLRLPQPSNAK